MKKVIFTEQVHPLAQELMSARSDVELIIAPDTSLETLGNLIQDAHGVGVRLALIPEEILSPANKLQVVSRHGVGCDNVDVAHLSSRNIPMAIAAGANGVSVAEHTLMLMLACTRRLREQDSIIRADGYARRTEFCGIDLHRSNALVIGFGRTGKQVAMRCKAFGMQVTVADIKPDYEAAKSIGCTVTTDYKSALADADFITLHVPLDASTQNMISAAEFAIMKPGVIIINCARGGVLDEAALLDSLDNGPVVAAGLDVFEQEPTVATEPLFKRDDVIVTPHTAGTSKTAIVNMATMMAQNILDCFDGKLVSENILNAEDIRN